MRTFTVALVATAAMGLATTALAQQTVNGPNQQPNIPQGTGEFQNNGAAGASVAPDGYNFRLMLLRHKLAAQTHDDGGQLTPEHQAALQKELDALNLHYRKALASR